MPSRASFTFRQKARLRIDGLSNVWRIVCVLAASIMHLIGCLSAAQICDHATEVPDSGRLRVDYSPAQQQPSSKGGGAAAYPEVYC